MILLSTNSYAQDYVSNIRIVQANDSIHINYDLNTDHKNGYLDKYQRTKTRRFDVQLLYSTDKNNYKFCNNTTGDVGKKIKQGKSKSISWSPLSEKYGYIGEMSFKIISEPIIPKISWGISFTKSIVDLGGDWDQSRANSLSLFLHHPFKNPKLSGIFIINITGSKSSFSREGTTSYNLGGVYSFNSDFVTVNNSQEKGAKYTSIIIGYGIQFNKRVFSIYYGMGPAFGSQCRSYRSYGDVQNKDGNWVHVDEISNVENSNATFTLLVGFGVKIMDTMPVSIILPIEYQFLPGNDSNFIEYQYLPGNVRWPGLFSGDSHFFKTGIRLQF